LPLHVDPIGHQLVDLREQRLDIEHYAVSYGAAHAGLKNSARYLVQHEGFLADVNRVAGVRSTLIANHPVSAFRDHVNELPLSFVAPLRAYDDNRARIVVEHRSYFAGRGGGT
jgi:hypothetical protein